MVGEEYEGNCLHGWPVLLF